MKKKYDVLLLDADETLLDFPTAERCAISEVLGRFGLPAEEETIRCYSTINAGLWAQLERGEITREELKVERFRRLLLPMGIQTDYSVAARLYIEALSSQTQLTSGAEDFCRRMQGIMPMFIITNGISEVQEKRIGGSAIAPYIDGLFVSEKVGAPKPNRAYFDYVCNSIAGICPDRRRMLIVGDSLTSDIAGALGAGIDAAWFNPTGRTRPGNIDGDVSVNIYEIRTLDEVCAIVGLEG